MDRRRYESHFERGYDIVDTRGLYGKDKKQQVGYWCCCSCCYLCPSYFADVSSLEVCGLPLTPPDPPCLATSFRTRPPFRLLCGRRLCLVMWPPAPCMHPRQGTSTLSPLHPIPLRLCPGWGGPPPHATWTGRWLTSLLVVATMARVEIAQEGMEGPPPPWASLPSQ